MSSNHRLAYDAMPAGLPKTFFFSMEQSALLEHYLTARSSYAEGTTLLWLKTV